MTDPILIRSDYVVQADDSLSFHNVGYAFGLVEYTQQDHPSLTIDGSVEVTSDSDTLVVNAIQEAPGSSSFNDVKVRIGSGASLTVEVSGTHAGASAIRISGLGAAIVNDGLISVTSASGAEGVFGAGSFVNTGRLSLSAAWDANAAYFNGTVDNSGLIEVNAVQGASGVFFRTTGDIVGDLHNEGRLFVTNTGELLQGDNVCGVEYLLSPAALDNSGRIIVRDATGGHQAIGVLLDQASAAQLVNAGLIKADTAILASTAADGVTLANGGKIVGDIVLGGHDDAITNTGKISGDIDLGDGDDSYLGATGKLKGALVGGEGADSIVGGKGDDQIHGDNLTHGADDGRDTITGGLGADTINGGGASDTFVYERVADSSGDRVDLIAQITNQDRIDLSRIDADTTHGGDQAFHLVSALGGHAGELAVSYDSASGLTTVAGDVDGDGHADLLIHLSGDHADFSHFVL